MIPDGEVALERIVVGNTLGVFSWHTQLFSFPVVVVERSSDLPMR
jgi:hypothetical protein